MRSRLRVVAAACLALVLASVAPAGAARPGQGELSRADAQVRWHGRLEGPAAAPGPSACVPGWCDAFLLTVRVPYKTWLHRAGGLQVAIRWADEQQDLDLYVYGPHGVLVGYAHGLHSTAEAVFVRHPMAGVYRVVVVAKLTEGPVEYEGLAELEYLPAVRPVRELLPNLVALPPGQARVAIGAYYLDPHVSAGAVVSCYPEEMVEQGARKCLRFDQGAANLGEGPFELRFFADGEGAWEDAYQRVYRSDGSYYDRKARKMELHVVHGHYHFSGFAQSRLWRSDAQARRLGPQPVRVGRKNGFCMIDVAMVRFGQKGDGPRTYAFPGCNAPADRLGPRAAMVHGITPGWADIYTWYLSDQYIEISGLPDGYYILETVVDPDRSVVESRRDDNCAASWIRLADGGTRVEVLGPGPACR